MKKKIKNKTIREEQPMGVNDLFLCHNVQKNPTFYHPHLQNRRLRFAQCNKYKKFLIYISIGPIRPLKFGEKFHLIFFLISNINNKFKFK